MRKLWIGFGVVGAVAIGLAGVALVRHWPTPEMGSSVNGRIEKPAAPATAPAVIAAEPIEEAPPVVAATEPVAPVVVAVKPPAPPPAPAPKPAAMKPNQKQPVATGGKQRQGGNKPPPTPEQQLARAALASVGVDANAEAFWLDAINDPSRSEHERKDLIEDLNEEGFPDPKHVGPDDLPLIASRIAIVEQHAPFAMDDVNNEAFAEAYKDLVNMYYKAAGQ